MNSECFITDIVHPAYVYSAKFLRETFVGDRFILITLCFDGKIRVYFVEAIIDDEHCPELITESYIMVDEDRNEEQLIDLRYPNTMTFGRNGIMFIGDSRGDVHIWEIKSHFKSIELSRIKSISDREIAGDPINSILIPNPSHNRLLIHTRDNCIREIDHTKRENSRIINRYYGAKFSKENIKSCLSPDGEYLLSGSEDGKVYIWGTTGVGLDTDCIDVEFKGSVNAVDWNPKYHMIAATGFGNEFPILIFVWNRRNEEELIVFEERRNEHDDEY